MMIVVVTPAVVAVTIVIRALIKRECFLEHVGSHSRFMQCT